MITQDLEKKLKDSLKYNHLEEKQCEVNYIGIHKGCLVWHDKNNYLSYILLEEVKEAIKNNQNIKFINKDKESGI